MPTLCFGGSFNPIHNAHLACAESIGRAKGYERVLLIPNAQSPLKPDHAAQAKGNDRLTMCQLAADYANQHANQAQPLVRLEVDDIEMRRKAPSYTLDTARQLHQQGIDSVHWLIGADMLMSLPHWHRPLELLKEVHFVIMARPGVTIDWPALPPEYQHLRSQVVEAPLINISATEVRKRVSLGEPIDDLVPPPVAQYIAEHGLYRA